MPTLEHLDNQTWPEPEYDSHLVTTVHRLRKKPLEHFTIEDLRIMLGQQLSAEYLMPLALDILERNPLAEGDFYPGDLFMAALTQPESFWHAYPGFAARTVTVSETMIDEIRQQWSTRAKEAWRQYGAQMDSHGVSERSEREFVEMAETFIAKHHGNSGAC
jgi:hypothetical protein